MAIVKSTPAWGMSPQLPLSCHPWARLSHQPLPTATATDHCAPHGCLPTPPKDHGPQAPRSLTKPLWVKDNGLWWKHGLAITQQLVLCPPCRCRYGGLWWRPSRGGRSDHPLYCGVGSWWVPLSLGIRGWECSPQLTSCPWSRWGNLGPPRWRMTRCRSCSIGWPRWRCSMRGDVSPSPMSGSNAL